MKYKNKFEWLKFKTKNKIVLSKVYFNYKGID